MVMCSMGLTELGQAFEFPLGGNFHQSQILCVLEESSIFNLLTQISSFLGFLFIFHDGNDTVVNCKRTILAIFSGFNCVLF